MLPLADGVGQTVIEIPTQPPNCDPLVSPRDGGNRRDTGRVEGGPGVLVIVDMRLTPSIRLWPSGQDLDRGDRCEPAIARWWRDRGSTRSITAGCRAFQERRIVLRKRGRPLAVVHPVRPTCGTADAGFMIGWHGCRFPLSLRLRFSSLVAIDESPPRLDAERPKASRGDREASRPACPVCGARLDRAARQARLLAMQDRLRDLLRGRAGLKRRRSVEDASQPVA